MGSGDYWGGVYSPTQNRIYLVAFGRTTPSTWHYINCNTEPPTVIAYTTGTTLTGSYLGGVYCPFQNRIYFAPHAQAISTTWHYLQPLTTANASISYSSSALMGN